MYSVVLMAALTAGPAAPACHRTCNGCWGGGYAGCYGGWGGHGGGWGCYSCYGGWGAGMIGNYGCHGCYGSYSCSSCYGCYGVGCYSAWGCQGCAGWGYGVVPNGNGTTEKKKGGSELPPPTEEKKKKKIEDDNVRATLTVELPEGARLFIDGSPVKATTARRNFVTPPLRPGQVYFYELRAEVIRDGQTVRANRRVLVTPGQAARASFPELEGTTPVTAPAGEQ
jgi:uncharacterized protein (TIGR03000 family)